MLANPERRDAFSTQRVNQVSVFVAPTDTKVPTNTIVQ